MKRKPGGDRQLQGGLQGVNRGQKHKTHRNCLKKSVLLPVKKARPTMAEKGRHHHRGTRDTGRHTWRQKNEKGYGTYAVWGTEGDEELSREQQGKMSSPT